MKKKNLTMAVLTVVMAAILAALVVLILFLTGDRGNEQENREPPKLTVLCGQTEYEAARGTYSWTYRYDDALVSVVADSLHPLQASEDMTSIRLYNSVLSFIDPCKAYLCFESKPDEVSVRYWKDWSDTDEDSKPLEVKPYSGEVEGAQFLLDLDFEFAIYEVVAKWNGIEGGTVSYSFWTAVPVISDLD